jgi:hypothetical protein
MWYYYYYCYCTIIGVIVINDIIIIIIIIVIIIIIIIIVVMSVCNSECVATSCSCCTSRKLAVLQGAADVLVVLGFQQSLTLRGASKCSFRAALRVGDGEPADVETQDPLNVFLSWGLRGVAVGWQAGDHSWKSRVWKQWVWR